MILLFFQSRQLTNTYFLVEQLVPSKRKCFDTFLIHSQVRKHFKPELLNRLDEIVVFDPLSHDQLRKVCRHQLKDVASRLAERGIALGVTEAALDVILAESYDPVRVIV